MNSKKHIILIDDEPVIHMACEMMLHGTNYRKTSITNLEEALAYPENKDQYDKPDILIVDLMLGSKSGIDVIKSIRKDPYFDNIPIILYTAYHEKIINQDELLEKLDIACVASKVIGKDELLAKIDFLVNLPS